ncbi:MAG: protocatechuate 4,5-dioxygenase subunit alpha [Acidimicrobiales bacterium]|uniref:protocatechuate 4,5-dioxygenase subunit alpha n=1 Tax=Candidatus Poriferisodalis multihospitum TaxID=2983191 RepID=UPI00137EA4BC|nr:protocatechuate 4,5-dioxygenase subunit alpha [Candidatus Poriferisodalis multihospitum]MCY3586604.1 protocatechuate 4,5-dioxygenase subunit alpha [Acidimicrobiaceae bacterium]MXX43449.1 protocatechuate 4,5-dioxygenase subunit alpha [Acidimicrobiales bacterium]MDE0319897.1 protocatechuate 4,5-dioxygenase subunit alpha [Acidimicrobiaceae bacterium]MXY01304.1 protocatechuate 4,5-dioxygenase subunit alpha [Acidimicrobiales bacterium]MXZ14714.1 protocatechuate 4,5-dioxygenase subunit alpha [Aci
MATTRDYDDIPGTYVFDGRRSQQGYHLNMFCMSLNAEANRERFRADEAAYVDGFDLSPEQRQAVLERDWLGMLQQGGNIYYTFKLAILDGLSMQDVGGAMSGVSGQEFTQMMIDGGRSIEGNRRVGESAATSGSAGGTP